MTIDVRTADLSNPEQAGDFLKIMHSYAMSDVGIGRGLSDLARTNCPPNSPDCRMRLH